ncbi:hypothetical protein AVEN_163125-1 [Araneus ventricosus]|uniref:Uncharacterized protein n=1 Tax=Araneus ventricosus TaxID=182803 RepID=A0A4Y2DIU0_ARAVE|nr:hypothetical protein AVEN_163125-1 [Araneus ventricosus]
MKPETAPFLWTRRKRRAPGVYRETDRALRQIRTPQPASPKALVQGLLRTVLSRGPDSTLVDFSKVYSNPARSTRHRPFYEQGRKTGTRNPAPLRKDPSSAPTSPLCRRARGVPTVARDACH